MMELVFRDVSQFDIIHFHCDYVHLPLVRRYACPNVTTIHGAVQGHDLRGLLMEYNDAPLISISNSQRMSIPEANWQGNVYHGLPEKLHTFREHTGEYLAFLGRTSPEKGLERAIEIARRTRIPLKVAAKIYPEDRNHFEQVIQPLLHKSASFVEFVGEVGGMVKDKFLGEAKALLFPVDWPEPFGPVMIEAMACGRARATGDRVGKWLSTRGRERWPHGIRRCRYRRRCPVRTAAWRDSPARLQRRSRSSFLCAENGNRLSAYLCRTDSEDG
jgi:glycosyltransferase involved in cell wall biosynthesis